MIPISKPLLGEEEEKLVLEVLRSGNLVQGEKVEEFEREFAKYAGARHAIATNSGTSSLHTALLAAGIGKGDEVITTPFTFIASVNSITFCQARPVFADIREEDFNINVKLIEDAITSKTKAIMPVHLYGSPCDMDSLQEIAYKHNLHIIEDACQAHGAEFNGRKVGTFGTGCFSFYPSKNMTTGEGGMITTNDDGIAERCRLIRNHGSKVRYYHEIVGYNYRMTNLAAAIGIPQLKKLEEFNNKRIKNAEYLTKRLSKLKWLITPKIRSNSRHVFHQYTLRITGKNRDEVAKILTSKGVGNSVYYPVPATLQKPYKELKVSMPVSEKMAKEVLSIPVHPALLNEELDYIAKTFEEM
ncbi:DegT/DnrJ/EryC1/StrS family aminotransferase [Candidatus Woesearchaeota archaeon]|nr:DegT/DnrJ/EryC1/StrS family aminotransferase [Candidatus Woesearchaeota archaeon]